MCYLGGKLQITEPKTKSSIRTVILPPALLEVPKAYRQTVDSRWMFPSPEKADAPLTQSYVKQVCKDLTDLGVDEIMLENFGWPSVGNMPAMLVPEGTDKPAVITAFVKDLRETLPKTTAVSVAINRNAPENSGLTAAVLAEFDRIYADPEKVDMDALAAAMPADFKREAQLVQLVTQAPAAGSYVLINE